MNFKGYYSLPVEISINDPGEVLRELSNHFFNRRDFENLEIKDNCIYYEEDISVHGSPYYIHKKITDDPKKIEILNSLKNIFKNI
jgi:hypothetical protein